MKNLMKINIKNLHACPGDGVIKKIAVPKEVFSEKDITEVQKEINEQHSETREEAKIKKSKRVTEKKMFGFKENLTYNLGGPYGKLAGLFKDAGKALWSQKVKGFKNAYKSTVKSLVIKPMWPELSDVDEGDIIKNVIPQITAGRGKAMIFQYYEVIPECTADIEIDVPEKDKEKFERLIQQAEGMPFGPKRRGEIEVVETKWVK